MPTLWIAKLEAADGCLAKLSGRHRLNLDELEDALLCRPGLYYRVEADSVRGRRYVLSITVRGLTVAVVLREVGEDAYRLITAYPL